MPLQLRRTQFGLASLFVLMTVVAIALWAWRFGPVKLAGIIAVTTGVLFVVVWLVLLAKEHFGRRD